MDVEANNYNNNNNKQQHINVDDNNPHDDKRSNSRPRHASDDDEDEADLDDDGLVLKGLVHQYTEAGVGLMEVIGDHTPDGVRILNDVDVALTDTDSFIAAGCTTFQKYGCLCAATIETVAMSKDAKHCQSVVCVLSNYIKLVRAQQFPFVDGLAEWCLVRPAHLLTVHSIVFGLYSVFKFDQNVLTLPLFNRTFDNALAEYAAVMYIQPFYLICKDKPYVTFPEQLKKSGVLANYGN